MIWMISIAINLLLIDNIASMANIPEKAKPLMDELRYWNYGDNPAFKKFMKIGMENTRGKQWHDHRTHVLDRGVRLTMSRNFDDFLQRDLKAFTFPRALGVWFISSAFFFIAARVSQRLIPIGRYGIRKINETQFYQNFGWLGVAGVGAWVGGTGYAWWKTTLFTANKFYRHIIQQNRNWIHQNLEVSKYGNYIYPESLLDWEDKFQDSQDRKIMMNALPLEEFTYYGPYHATPNVSKKE